MSCLYGCVVIALCIQINTIVCSCDVVELFFGFFFLFLLVVFLLFGWFVVLCLVF
ncbi:hypothetical protein [Methanobrevibacter arboriphilus]|uniref:hypothetical protein n=1 Tax=Methanobrevibacter arboriphilus TaxID=39441 RepID=UPI0012E2DB99|nr:hypothetical protein [Methanobrevibacter arboriphilus]